MVASGIGVEGSRLKYCPHLVVIYGMAHGGHYPQVVKNTHSSRVSHPCARMRGWGMARLVKYVSHMLEEMSSVPSSNTRVECGCVVV